MQGVELMVFGVSAVAIFLTLLVVVTSLTSRFMSRYYPEAPEAPAEVPAMPGPQPRGDHGQGELVAAIAAAIHQHRKQRH